MQYHLGPRLYEKLPGCLVRLAEDLRKSTVFLGFDVAEPDGSAGIDARATGFFVLWASVSGLSPSEEKEREQAGIYLITARHCAEHLGSKFVIRYNKKDGVSSDAQLIDSPQWICHEDATVDVAVLHCGYPEWADCVPIHGTMLMPFAALSGGSAPNHVVGIGDIAYVVGLFNPFSGKKLNLPVTYTGHIALLPRDEKIPVYDKATKTTHMVEGYLVQAPGLDGLSGAPVFCRSSYPVYGDYRPDTNPPLRAEHTAIPGRLHGMTMLLGLWQSSWADPPDETLAKYAPSTIGRKVPVGFGVTVPAYKIAETLNRQELLMARREEFQRRIRDSAATTDFVAESDAPTTPGDENPDHREDFNQLVSAASKPKPKGGRT